MYRTQRTRLAAGSAAFAGALLTVGLAGCSVTSPSVITTPYPASDGVNATLGTTGVGLRNFLVVGTAKGAPASVIGAVVNDSDASVQVSLQADLGETAQPSQTVVRVPPHSSVSIGPNETSKMVIPDLPVIPGANTGISAATPNGGRADVVVPVLAASNEYASLAPAPTTSGPSPSSSKPSESQAGGGGATGTPSVPTANDDAPADEATSGASPTEG